jgi:hypothetical protein
MTTDNTPHTSEWKRQHPRKRGQEQPTRLPTLPEVHQSKALVTIHAGRSTILFSHLLATPRLAISP